MLSGPLNNLPPLFLVFPHLNTSLILMHFFCLFVFFAFHNKAVIFIVVLIFLVFFLVFFGCFFF